MTKSIYNRHGFTLVELIISLAILAMISVFLIGFLGPQFRVYTSTVDKTVAKSMCGTIYNTIEEEVRFGKNYVASNSSITFDDVTEEDEIITRKIDGNDIANQLYPYFEGGINVTMLSENDILYIKVDVSDITGEVINSVTGTIKSPNS